VSAFWKKQAPKLLVVALFVAFYLVFSLTGTECLFKTLFVISCPGCGFTHAVLALFQLDFPAAFRYHPMVWSFPFLVAFFLFGDVVHTKAVEHLMALILVGFGVVWVLRLI